MKKGVGYFRLMMNDDEKALKTGDNLIDYY